MRTIFCRNAWLSNIGRSDGVCETEGVGRGRVRRRVEGLISHSGSNAGKYPALDAADVPRRYCWPNPLLARPCICDAPSISDSDSKGSGLKLKSLFIAFLPVIG